MPAWNDILNEINAAGSTHDIIRRKYLSDLYKRTGRNIIVYYSGWLQKSQLLPNDPGIFSINEEDKNAFMSAIDKLDLTKGLDLILHTPGGDIAATESLVYYLRAMFGTNIRAIIPQIAMSAGTMIACACKEIIMGEHSSIGPIDPQLNGIPAHGIIEEFKRAFLEIKEDSAKIPLWQPIIAKYSPTLIGECEKAIKWSSELVKSWLVSGMFAGEKDGDSKAYKVIQELGDHALTLSHARHISIEHARNIGLKVTALEDDKEFQDIVLSIHHACMHTLENTACVKIIENHLGVAVIKMSAIQVMAKPF
ncbi:MAG TPA: S49 family peptidase [Thermoanaerobacterium sp.]|nr:S49 family peptidase [Thermoanaerobacterium sp.]